MEGIGSLLLVAIGGAGVVGFVLGLAMPARRGMAATLTALIGFGLITGEHLRLNGPPEDATPFVLYAVVAAIAFVPAFIGAAFAASLRSRNS